MSVQPDLFDDAREVPPPGLRRARAYRQAILGYVRNLLAATDVGRRCEDGKPLVLSRRIVRRVLESERDLPNVDLERKLELFIAVNEKVLVRPPPPDRPILGNLELLSRVAGLTRVEARTLLFLLAVRLSNQLEELTDCFELLTLEGAVQLVSVAIAEPVRFVRRALSPAGRLVSSGLVAVVPHPDFIERKLTVSVLLPDMLAAPRLDRVRLLDAFAPRPPRAVRVWSDLAAAVAGADLLRDLIHAAARERRAGVNVLLHGPTGCGKSELVRALAENLSLDVREATSGPGTTHLEIEPRLTTLLGLDQLVRDGGSLLLFDAIEDVLEPAGPTALGPRTTRAFMERRLESNAVPTIWTATDASRLDPALLRRFRLVLQVPAPEERAHGVWRAAQGETQALPDAEVESLSRRFPASAAEVAQAIDTARLAGRPDAASIGAVLDGSLRARGIRASDGRSRGPAYRLEALNASSDVCALTNRLSGWRREDGGVALLLHGPPGTGKSEWVHELARRLERPVIARGASDVESMWVGESEKNLARAFREAEDRGAVLLFDEVDSFLRDRRAALQRFEVALTNEFLQRLDAHRGIVAATTNLLDALDLAVLRRFPLKVEFRPSTPEQALLLFEGYFAPLLGREALDAARDTLQSGLAAAGALTPGDFAAVERRLRLTHEASDCEGVLRLLREEVALRSVEDARHVGFAAPTAPAARMELLREAARSK